MVRERFKELIEMLKHNPYSFAEKIKVAPTIIYNIIGGRKSKPGFEVLEKIKRAYPEVNLNWLVTGKEQPLLDNDEVPEIVSKIKDISKQLETLADVRDQYISVLKTKMDTLKDQVKQSKKKSATQDTSSRRRH